LKQTNAPRTAQIQHAPLPRIFITPGYQQILQKGKLITLQAWRGPECSRRL